MPNPPKKRMFFLFFLPVRNGCCCCLKLEVIIVLLLLLLFYANLLLFNNCYLAVEFVVCKATQLYFHQIKSDSIELNCIELDSMQFNSKLERIEKNWLLFGGEF